VRQPQEAGDEAEYFGLRCVGEGRVVSPRVALTSPKAGNFDYWIDLMRGGCYDSALLAT